MLEIRNTSDGGRTVVALTGKLDAVTAPDLEKLLGTLLPETADLTIDMEGLEYISSAGLRVLLSTMKIMDKQEGKLRITRVSAPVMSIFDTTGFSDILNIE